MNSDRPAERPTLIYQHEPELSAEDFVRVDEMPDEMFYGMPRLVTHIDDAACAALAAYYKTFLQDGIRILDLMSSCVSHLPETLKPERVVGHGMNVTELEANPQLDEYFIQNLNRNPVLAVENDMFDACLIAVSVQYLTDPVAIFTEIGRILKPGGSISVSFSNRMFPTKAVAIWRQTGDEGHGALVASYLRRAGMFNNIDVRTISPAPGRSDPLYVVSGSAV